jgi:hydrogenase-4 component F
MGGLVAATPLLPIAVAVAIAALGWRTTTAWASAGSAYVIVAVAVAASARVVDRGPVTALDGEVRVDALSAVMLLIIGIVGSITATYATGYIGRSLTDGSTTPRHAIIYGVLVQVTIAALVVVVIADNLGVMWVAIETTTVATVLLVGHRRDSAAIEASWKYLVLGSVGIATALLGTVLVYFVARHSGVDIEAGLRWSRLVTVADQLDPAALRLPIGLVIVGYGTKAGLAPLHSWLPDAYSQAPAPVAGLMAGTVSAMSMYAIMRFAAVASPALGDEFVRNLLITAALASLAVAASFMITQRDLKRLLAYSSVEHVGLIALGVAVGSHLAISAALLHMIGNGTIKAVAFSTVGEVERQLGTTTLAVTRGLLARDRFTGTTFALCLIALAGLPPFSLLASEIALIRAGLADGFAWIIAIALVAMMTVFTALAVHAITLLTGRPTEPRDDAPVEPQATPLAMRIPLAAGLALVAALGITIWPIARLIDHAAAVLAP